MFFENLLINNQKFKCVQFNLDNMHFNLEAVACNNQQTHVLIDHYLSSVTVFNYDYGLFSDFGSDHNNLSVDWLAASMQLVDKNILRKYAGVMTDYFLHKKKELNKYLYFSICYNYDSESANKAIRIKIIPLVYTEDKNLYASLCIIEPINYTGKPILKMHKVDEDKVLIYIPSSDRFVDEEETRLSRLECDILCMSGEGVKEQDIANNLDIPLFYLKRCKNSIFEKLKVKSISEAIYVAYKQGLL